MLHLPGVLDDTHIHYVSTDLSGKTAWSSYPVNTSLIDHAGDLIELALEHRRNQLWILPGSILSHRIGTSEDETFVTDALEDYNIFPGEVSHFLNGWKYEGNREGVSLVFPEIRVPKTEGMMLDQETLYTFLHLAPKDLFTTITYMYHASGIPFSYSTGRTGLNLLKRLNDTPERRGFLSPCESDLTPFYANRAGELSWSRPLTSTEADMLYLHEFDRRAMFLSACSGLAIGGKVCSYQARPAFNKRVPGLYHVKLSGTSLFNHTDLPHPFKGHTDAWVSTPLVQAAMECGYQVEIIEAYIFEDYHTTLTPWYETLRGAKQALTEDTATYKNELARVAALSCIKLYYTRAIGLLGYEKEEGKTLQWDNRPDWRNMIVDEATHRMLLTLLKLDQAVTSHFIGMWVDNLWFVSDNPNPYESVPGLPIAPNIGKYKYEGTFPLQEVKHMITDQPATLVNGLAQYKREREVIRYA